ncbi:MAG TPA: LysR substrate-binding domain-containing protein, partial [Burkholderiaceae bacterium]
MQDDGFRQLPALNALRCFEAAARHGSFARAAEELCLSPAAVSQAIAQLERKLGQPLFSRHVRRVALTPAGVRLSTAARQALQLIQHAIRDLSPDARSVRISAPPNLTAYWLVPRLARLAERHPEVRLDVESSSTLADLHATPFDFAIRYAEHDAAGFEKIPLFAQRLTPVCAPALARQLHTVEDLRSVRLLHEDDGSRWRGWLDHATAAGVDAAPRLDWASGLYFSQGALCMAAALQGVGVTLTEPAIASISVARGELVFPLATPA